MTGHDATSPDDVMICLRALGNTGDPRALPANSDALRSSEPVIRGVAVSALRLIDDPSVDPLIDQTLRADGDDRVRSQAVFADGYRPLDRILPSLQAAVQRDPASRVRLGIVQLLGTRRKQSASCDPVLTWVEQHDGDASIRTAAADALKS